MIQGTECVPLLTAGVAAPTVTTCMRTSGGHGRLLHHIHDRSIRQVTDCLHSGRQSTLSPVKGLPSQRPTDVPAMALRTAIAPLWILMALHPLEGQHLSRTTLMHMAEGTCSGRSKMEACTSMQPGIRWWRASRTSTQAASSSLYLQEILR